MQSADLIPLLAMTLDERLLLFTKEVIDIGGTIYTKEMLKRFTAFWSEPDRARKPKMRYEREKTWKTAMRLQKWAQNNYDGIVCLLTAGEKTIAEKRKAFAESMHPFVGVYHRDTLNEFYRWYSMPENKTNPEYLRWELLEFWDLSTKLAAWADREAKRKARQDERT